MRVFTELVNPREVVVCEHCGCYLLIDPDEMPTHTSRRAAQRLIDLGIDKARQFAEMIRAAGDFELTSEPTLNLLTYRYVPPIARQQLLRGGNEQKAANLGLDSLNESIQKEQRSGGKTFVSRTRLETAAHGGQVPSRHWFSWPSQPSTAGSPVAIETRPFSL